MSSYFHVWLSWWGLLLPPHLSLIPCFSLSSPHPLLLQGGVWLEGQARWGLGHASVGVSGHGFC